MTPRGRRRGRCDEPRTPSARGWQVLLGIAALVVALAMCATLAGTARAATWMAPQTLVPLSSTSPIVWGTDVAVTPSGTTTVVWRTEDNGTTTIHQSTRPSGGVFGAPSTVGETPSTGPAASNNFRPPRIAVAPGGAMTVVWSSGGVVYQSTRLSPGGAFSAPTALSATSGSIAGGPDVAMSGAGTTVVVWDATIAVGGSHEARIEQATRTPSTPFTAPQTLFVEPAASATRTPSFPDLALASDGTGIVAWGTLVSGGTRVSEVTRSANGTFSPARTVTMEGGPPQVVAGPGGRATLAYQRTSFPGGLHIAPRTTGAGPLGPPLGAPGSGNALGLAMDMTPNGTTVLTWTQPDPPTMSAAYRSEVSPDGIRGAAVRLSDAGAPAYLTGVGVADDDTVQALWTEGRYELSGSLVGSTRPPGAPFTPASRVPETAKDAYLYFETDVGPDGTIGAIWSGGRDVRVLAGHADSSTDSDRDGVDDALDRCPYEAGLEAEQGCPKTEPPPTLPGFLGSISVAEQTCEDTDGNGVNDAMVARLALVNARNIAVSDVYVAMQVASPDGALIVQTMFPMSLKAIFDRWAPNAREPFTGEVRVFGTLPESSPTSGGDLDLQTLVTGQDAARAAIDLRPTTRVPRCARGSSQTEDPKTTEKTDLQQEPQQAEQPRQETTTPPVPTPVTPQVVPCAGTSGRALVRCRAVTRRDAALDACASAPSKRRALCAARAKEQFVRATARAARADARARCAQLSAGARTRCIAKANRDYSSALRAAARVTARATCRSLSGPARRTCLSKLR